MKILYFDCSMGAAGDMLTAALLDLLPEEDRADAVGRLNALGIPGVQYELVRSEKCGITGSHMNVLVNGGTEETAHHHDHEHHGHEHGEAAHHHHHHHASLHSIEHIIWDLHLPEKTEKDALAVFRLLAEAESSVHGKPVTDIHFHEVGTIDAVADIAAVCLLIEKIAPDRIVVSPVHTGSGTVFCAHGELPVPAPATAMLLKDVPIYSTGIKGELTTPTGAALLKYFADCFGEMPAMNVSSIGYGMGTKDFERANCLRVFLGESGDSAYPEDTVLELSCNVDDMTAEEIGFSMERLFEGGAREVFTVPVGMKKNRPGTMIRVICSPDLKQDMLRILFKHTTTIGVRENVTRRYVLDRSEESVETPYGPVRRKDVSGYGAERSKYEYEDLARIARENQISLREAEKLIGECSAEA